MEVSQVVTPTITTTSEEHPHYLGWIILSGVLAGAALIFILLWVFALHNCNCPSPPPGICFGPFGVVAGIDANALSSCGTSQSDPCIFAVNTLAAAETQCNTLQSICNAFTFNESTATMKIVQPTNTFASNGTNLFVRQPESQ